VLYDVSYGVLMQLYVGTFPDAVNLRGKPSSPVFDPISNARTDTQDPQLGKELWAWLEDQVEGL
ncbi:hypothetical protein BKA82DRAFT_140518, partial [Pisolithus tinctorius]